MTSQLVPIPRHLKTTSPGRVVGIDYLSLVEDKFGNTGCYVLRDHFTKFVFIQPAASHDQSNAALAIFNYCVLYGAFNVLMSDPGSELLSAAVAQVNEWFGIHHTISLVDRHESNGVEGANKQILRHLRKLYLEERIKDTWSAPSSIGWAMYLINKFDISESGYCPYDLTFGTVTDRRFDFPKDSVDKTTAHQYVKLLDSSLKSLTKLAHDYQQELVTKRIESSVPQNLYQPGDLVLFRLPKDKPKPHKLHPMFLGPFEVLQQKKNDVEVRHMSTAKISTFFVSDLRAFFGSRSEARALASIDADQYVIRRLTAYRGDPLLRTSMYFLVEYADNDILWLPWSKDLQDSIPYEDFCRSIPCLKPLIESAASAAKWVKTLRQTPVTSVVPTQEVSVDIRSFGANWYATLDLPNKDSATYVAPCTFGKLHKAGKQITLTCPLLKHTMLVDNVWIQMYASTPPPGTSLRVDQELMDSCPTLRTLQSPTNSSQSDFDYLIGRTFYDPDAKRSFLVSSLSTTRSRDIVAHVRPILSSGRKAPVDDRPYHVADVVQMLRN
jgi:hypothetical protein